MKAKNYWMGLSIMTLCFRALLWGAKALLIFGTTKWSAFLTNTILRFALVVHGGVLGPLRLVRHTWQCPRFSVFVEVAETETRMLLGGIAEKSFSPVRGHSLCFEAKQWLFTFHAPLLSDFLRPPCPACHNYTMEQCLRYVFWHTAVICNHMLGGHLMLNNSPCGGKSLK